jgi:DNA polymerase III epsilon subunit-like protein
MKYLSFDIEATGLAEDDLIIEFALIPFCTESGKLEDSLSWHTYISCPPFEELKPRLDQWVIDHNKELIDKAHSDGITLSNFKNEFEAWLSSNEVKEYFKDQPIKKIVLFGKSLNAIDLPFLNRDLGWNFMREYFHHQVLDLSSTVISLVDMGKLPKECLSGSGLMKHMGMGDVAHTALEDAVNTAKMYLKLLEK